MILVSSFPRQANLFSTSRGTKAFDYLAKLTAPGNDRSAGAESGHGMWMQQGANDFGQGMATLTVLEEKTVAGFNAVVLETDSTTALDRLAEGQRLCVFSRS